MFATIPTSEHTATTLTAEEVARRMFPNLPAEVTNELVAQNNALTAAIAHAEDLEGLKVAERQFRLVSGLWHAIGYGYKAAEVRDRLVRRATELARDEKEYADGYTDGRKRNSRHIRNCYARVAALEAYAAEL